MIDMRKFYDTYRLPRPSFFGGIASLWDFAGAMHTYRPLSDAEALEADWYVIGDDLAEAMELFAEEVGYIPDAYVDSRLESGVKPS